MELFVKYLIFVLRQSTLLLEFAYTCSTKSRYVILCQMNFDELLELPIQEKNYMKH